MRIGETPVLISNTMVKTYTADDTTLATAWESRWLPDYFLNNNILIMLQNNLKLKSTYIKIDIKALKNILTRQKIYK